MSNLHDDCTVTMLVEKAEPTSSLFQDKVLCVKLTGDGTKIGKRLHVVNLAFTILEENIAESAAGNHCIAIFKKPEKYEPMKKCLEDIVREVESISSLTVGQHTFEVKFYLGGDWKFLAMVTGIDSAASNYACIWCKCPSLERHDVSQDWSITDCGLGAEQSKKT